MRGSRSREVLVAAHHAGASGHDAELADPALAEWGRAMADALDARVLRPRAAAARAPRGLLRAPIVILTSPAQWWLTRCFPRAVFFYYAIDNYALGYGWTPAQVTRWERRIVRRCARVVAVSTALAAELGRRHALPARQLVVSPNAVPAELIAPQPAPRRRFTTAAPPLAGVLGRISGRLRLTWLCEAVAALPWLHWRFAGAVDEAELEPGDGDALAWLRRHPRCQFLGRLPYRELVRQAGAVDVGVVPYSDRSTNPWGSPARLFMHLAAGRPVLGTAGCAQLAEFAPLVTLCDDAPTLVASLDALRRCEFDDGLQAARLAAAREHTWARRAALMAALIADVGAPARAA